MIRMKKLISSGVPGANEGYVRRGREFVVANEQRAKDLEAAGLAYRLDVKPMPEVRNDMIPSPANTAAFAGPLASPGGTTGADAPVPSSQADHPQRRRRSQRSKDEDLLS